MVREIVFHLGDCKTGTTAIQSVLASGKIECEKSICYPTRFNHIPLARTLSDPQERPFQKKRFAKLRRAFDQSDADIGVVSAEHFEFVDPDEIKRAIDQYLPEYADKIRLIAYVRPHAERLVSTFAERSKKGQTKKTMEFMHERLLAENRLFYTPRFSRLLELFGDQFTLRPFIRSHLQDGDVVTDFLHMVFRGSAFKLPTPTKSNESLSVRDIALMRYLQNKIQNLSKDKANARDAQRALGWYMSELLASLRQEDAERPRLYRELAEKMVDTYAGDAALLDDLFFEGTPMSDALEQAPQKALDHPQSFRAVDHLTEAELRQTDAWAVLMARMIDADSQHFAWALRPEEQRAPKPPRARGRFA